MSYRKIMKNTLLSAALIFCAVSASNAGMCPKKITKKDRITIWNYCVGGQGKTFQADLYEGRYTVIQVICPQSNDYLTNPIIMQENIGECAVIVNASQGQPPLAVAKLIPLLK